MTVQTNAALLTAKSSGTAALKTGLQTPTEALTKAVSSTEQ